MSTNQTKESEKELQKKKRILLTSKRELEQNQHILNDNKK